MEVGPHYTGIAEGVGPCSRRCAAIGDVRPGNSDIEGELFAGMACQVSVPIYHSGDVVRATVGVAWIVDGRLPYTGAQASS